jgi:hypothetical protein
MKRERIIEILKDHELKRTDGVHQVMISGIFPELYDKLAEAIELKLSLTQQDESKVSVEKGMSAEVCICTKPPTKAPDYNLIFCGQCDKVVEDGSDIKAVEKWKQYAQHVQPSVSAEKVLSPDEFAKKHFFKGNMRISAPFKVPEPQVYHMMRAYAQYCIENPPKTEK